MRSRGLGLFLLALAAAGPAAGEAAPSCVQPELRALPAVPDDDPAPLPRGLAPGESELPRSVVSALASPPSGEVFTPPEYARNLGLLIRWGSFNAILTAITVAITDFDPDATIWVVVSGASQQGSATAALSAAGADMARVAFLTAPTNSVWIRDYGPRFIEEDHAPAIIDHVYNRPRPLDDALPGAVAVAWGLPRYDLALVHGGGNFHLFADRQAFMTDLVIDENPPLTADDVEALFAQYEALDVTIWPGFPTSFDSTRHIDMWMLPARTRGAIVGQYAPGDGTPYTITEAAVDELEMRGYTVWRTPGWCAGCPFGVHYTYTNAVVLNRVVLVPQYAAYPAANQQALATFAAAFPDRQIVGIDADAIVGSAGVFHCIVMHVPDPAWIFADGFESADTTQWSSASP